MADKYLELIDGVVTEREVITQSLGYEDAGKIPGLGDDGRLDIFMMSKDVVTTLNPADHGGLTGLSDPDHVVGALNFTDTDKLAGRSTAGAGAGEEIACTAAARSILDDATVGAILTTIGGVAHSLATAANDFLVASGAGAFVKKTLAETQTILGDLAGEGYIFISAWPYFVIGQGTFSLLFSSTQYLGSTIHNDSNANLDNTTYKVYLAKGTYQIRILGDKDVNRGIMDIDLGGVEVGSFDNYNAAHVSNETYFIDDVVISTPGVRDLTIRVHGKNAASSGYYISFGPIILNRTV